MILVLNFLKNTVLLFVLILISCGNNTKNKIQDKNKGIDKVELEIVVGANQTEAYLPLLKGKNIGIVANQTSVIFKKKDSIFNFDPETNEVGFETTRYRYTHLVDSLFSLNFNIKKVFSPEHGFRGNADAGDFVKDGIDTKTGLPIVSLYGKNKKPYAEQLKDLDIVIFDIQDVGIRFYTYTSTLQYMMEACAEQGIPIIILDRPNPNGHYVDGPTLEIKHKSYLGMQAIPLVHGMTIGEYAQMLNGENWLLNKLKCEIIIIQIKNYTHDTFYSLPIRPSPNLPNDQAIKLYPSLGLFEGTNINAGRGTEFQFQRYGAPFLNKTNMPFTYIPYENFGAKNPKHKNELCYGEDLKDETNNGMTLKWIIKAYKNSTDKSLFFNTDNFTKHAGTTILKQQIESGLSEKEIKSSWKSDLEKFKAIRSKYKLYK